MITTPRCGQPVEYYDLQRPRDELDVIRREPGEPDEETGRTYLPCFRPRGHNGNRHLSEAAVRRAWAQHSAWRRRRRNVGAS